MIGRFFKKTNLTPHALYQTDIKRQEELER